MNKKTIWISLGIIVCVLTGAGWYLRDTLVSRFGSIHTSPVVHSGAVDELITKNYKPEFHHLDLRSKKLGKMPDICSMVVWTNYEFDIWGLDLADNGIVEIDQDLSCLKNLSELYLSFNTIPEIKNLEGLTFLKKLDLGNNTLTKIEWLEKLQNLADLHLGYNKISTTSGLEKLTNLTSLQLQSNALEDISNLVNLTQLETLKMEFNKLDTADIKIVENLKKLKIITVGENPLIDPKIVERLNELSRKNMK